MIHNYTYETMYNAKTHQKDVVFTFENFPEIGFTYKNIRFGEADSDKMVPVLFDLEFTKKEPEESDKEFENQTKMLLIQLLKEANDKAARILENNKSEIEN